MNTNFIPILVVPAVPFQEGIRFLHRETQIDIGPDMTETLWKILSFTNGYNNIASIAKLTEISEDAVLQIISELYDMELIVDSKEQFMHFHRISSFPSTFNCSLSQDEIEEYSRSKRLPVKIGEVFEFDSNKESSFYTVRQKRRSCRNFSNQKLTLDQVGSICHYAYSIYDHSVPSGGALYPLKIYVLIEKAQEGLKAGYYEYDAELDRLVCFNSEPDEEQLMYCFDHEKMPFDSSVQVVIAADLKRQPHKYSNRGYRLTLIEVGHVAENISLYCAEQGLGACEMGGVQDEPLKNELELDENIWPILAIPIGYPADHNIEEFNKVRYIEEHVGDNHVVNEVWANDFKEDGAFFGAVSSYKDECGNLQFAGATSTSYVDATFKALIEGYERWASSQVRVDFSGSAKELSRPWMHPKLIAPLTEEQARKNGVVPFSEDLSINWTKGISFDGTEIYIPSDIVYYGHKSDKNRIYYGHSSGIAAYSNLKEAKKRALVELIERDAIMRSWYTRQSPNVVDDKLLPVHVRKRRQHWAKKGRKLKVLQLPSDYGWVFEVVFVSDEYPFFISGAAATIDKNSINKTINKALQEAEYSLLMTLKNPEAIKMDPKDVSTPSEHGDLYCHEMYAKKLCWLYEGDTEKAFQKPKYTGYRQLLEVLKVVWVNLSDQNELGLKVVRVFSPKLIPINFGFYTAHYTHPSLKNTVHPNSLEMPHYFA